ncbi:MAG: hypothetical protein HYS08_00470 [Chlamydiae bacterium]|nr:hypothetical protein [Chlamydiota bacterium]MBI3266216.1 hypothetical protein [Chlamydiota bacterium]
MKLKSFVEALFLVLTLAVFHPGKSLADEMKRDVFILGIQLGGAECTASLNEAFSTAERPGSLDLIKRNLSWSIDTSRRMGNPANSLVQLQSQLDQLTFPEIRQSLLGSIEFEQNTWASLSTQISSLFILGVHLEGAECVASYVQSFSREEKPGSLDLIRRNVTWVQQETRSVNLGLTTKDIDELVMMIDQGSSFQDILRKLEMIRLAWQKQLESQAGF